MTTLTAQPHDRTAEGFSFDTTKAFEAAAARSVNAYGQRVEEFVIEFIDGADIDWRPPESPSRRSDRARSWPGALAGGRRRSFRRLGRPAGGTLRPVSRPTGHHAGALFLSNKHQRFML